MVDSLKNGDDIIMYPAGRLYRSQFENLAGNSGIEFIITQVPDARVVLVRTSGLWGSSYGRANDPAPSLLGSVPAATKYFLSNLLFFGPRRKVTVEFKVDKQIG